MQNVQKGQENHVEKCDFLYCASVQAIVWSSSFAIFDEGGFWRSAFRRPSSAAMMEAEDRRNISGAPSIYLLRTFL